MIIAPRRIIVMPSDSWYKFLSNDAGWRALHRSFVAVRKAKLTRFKVRVITEYLLIESAVISDHAVVRDLLEKYLLILGAVEKN